MINRRVKLENCLLLAREASRDSWQLPGMKPSTRAALRQIRREAIEDARYWRSKP